MLNKRIDGVPVAYLLGQREFWSFELEVSTDVLIPRADTETLVSAALDRLPSDKEDTILELGTGSGAIAIALASECTHPIIATDISEQALAIAKRNAQRHVPGRIQFLSSNWLSEITAMVLSDSEKSLKVSMIVANPPYLAADDEHLPDLRYEPQGALIAADDGLADIRTIITDATNILPEGGIVMLEHGMSQGSAVRELFAQHGYTSIETLKDLANLERVTLGRR